MAETLTTDAVTAMPPLLARAVPDIGTGRWRLRAYSTPMAARQRGKRLLYSTISYVDTADGSEHVDDIVVKIADGDRRHGYDAGVRLWQGGFRAPARFRVPRPYGYGVDDGAAVLELVRGPTWADRLGGATADLREASEHATDWLLELQRQEPGRPPPAPADTVSAARRSDRGAPEVGADLARAFRTHAQRLTFLAAAVEDALADPPGERVAAHGDFHPKNVIVTDAATTVLDFDTFGAREAAFDVGYAMGQLLVMSQLRLGRLRPGAVAAQHVWSRYSSRGRASWERVRAHIARTLIQSLHFELCVLRNDHVELLDLWATLIEQVLAAGAPDGVVLTVSVREGDE